MDIQKMLDDWLEANPDYQKYVRELWYIKEGTVPPEGVTHILRLQSNSSAERHLSIGIVAVPQYAFFIEVFLAAIATQGKFPF